MQVSGAVEDEMFVNSFVFRKTRIPFRQNIYAGSTMSYKTTGEKFRRTVAKTHQKYPSPAQLIYHQITFNNEDKSYNTYAPMGSKTPTPPFTSLRLSCIGISSPTTKTIKSPRI